MIPPAVWLPLVFRVMGSFEYRNLAKSGSVTTVVVVTSVSCGVIFLLASQTRPLTCEVEFVCVTYE